jgi:hypothetical protein
LASCPEYFSNSSSQVTPSHTIEIKEHLNDTSSCSSNESKGKLQNYLLIQLRTLYLHL